MVSLKTIAEKCGVSTATVSKALNDQRDISEETKNRVRKTAEALGYFPNAAARALKTNRSYNIGVLFEEDAGSGLTHEYFSGRCLIMNIADTGILKELQLSVPISMTRMS